ncbi:MAG: hypothetical protein IMZ52_03035 [Actinobacteria bacterium]|nr:hypothetical protein [Actinomycetota bacterium]MBE3114795.1 hypothetical protein [Actinomycetota bacterium]
MLEETIAVLGIIFLVGVLTKIIHYTYRLKMVYLASDLSREIQGIEKIQKPPLKNLVNLVKFLISRRDEIVEQVSEDDSDDKYRNTYG